MAANAERNVIGYRVFNPSSVVICNNESSGTSSASTACIDKNPPLTTATAANLTYKVVALYRKPQGEVLSEAISEGLPGSFTLAGEPPPSVPGPAVGPLNATREGDVVTLTWSAPTPAPAFYRIYRGSTDYTSRYDVTGSGATTTYTDNRAVGSQSYWVTAVNSNLRESSFLGPVNIP